MYRDAGPQAEGGQGVAGGGGTSANAGSSATNEDFAVHIEDLQRMTIEIVTLRCAGDCADVVAVASGGNAPYTYRWEDGGTAAQRHVCLPSTKTLEVSATDTAITDSEFRHEARTTMTTLTANVLTCTDAGMPSGDGDFCIANPSLEGTPGLTEQGFDLPDWTICSVTPDVGPIVSTLPASDGATYLGMVGGAGVLYEGAGTKFCSTLMPNSELSFTVDIATSTFLGGAGQLQIWGGATSCASDELLWTSPLTTDTETWHSYCGTLKPKKADAFFVIRPAELASGAATPYLLVDNFRPAASCP